MLTTKSSDTQVGTRYRQAESQKTHMKVWTLSATDKVLAEAGFSTRAVAKC